MTLIIEFEKPVRGGDFVCLDTQEEIESYEQAEIGVKCIRAYGNEKVSTIVPWHNVRSVSLSETA